MQIDVKPKAEPERRSTDDDAGSILGSERDRFKTQPSSFVSIKSRCSGCLSTVCSIENSRVLIRNDCFLPSLMPFFKSKIADYLYQAPQFQGIDLFLGSFGFQQSFFTFSFVKFLCLLFLYFWKICEVVRLRLKPDIKGIDVCTFKNKRICLPQRMELTGWRSQKGLWIWMKVSSIM